MNSKKNVPNQNNASCLKAFLKRLFCGNEALQKAFDADKLVRQKFVLSQASRHLNLNKFEPAPLLHTKVLDVGCGELNLGKDLTLRGAEVTAIDIDDEVLESAKKQADHFGVSINFQNARPEDLVLTGEKYDIILCLDVMEHAEQFDRFVWALNKLLKPSGLIIFSTHNKSLRTFYWYSFFGNLIRRWRSEGGFKYYKFIKPRHLQEVFAKHDFSITHLRGLIFSKKSMSWEKSEDLGVRYMGTARRAADL